MTTEELDSFATVPEMATIFRNTLAKEGCFYILKEKGRGEYTDSNNEKWRWVEFEAKAYRRLESGKKQLIANAFSREEQGISEFNKVNYYMTAQTRAIGKMFKNLGILVDKGMSSREEVASGAELMDMARKEERVARVPKVKAPDIRASLKRLRVKFTEKDDAYIIDSYKGYSDKTMLALNKYGFQEVNDKLVCAKEKNEN